LKRIMDFYRLILRHKWLICLMLYTIVLRTLLMSYEYEWESEANFYIQASVSEWIRPIMGPSGSDSLFNGSVAPGFFYITYTMTQLNGIDGVMAVKITRAVLSVINVLIIYRISHLLFKDRNVALISGFIFATVFYESWWLGGNELRNLLGETFILGGLYLLLHFDPVGREKGVLKDLRNNYRYYLWYAVLIVALLIGVFSSHKLARILFILLIFAIAVEKMLDWLFSKLNIQKFWLLKPMMVGFICLTLLNGAILLHSRGVISIGDVNDYINIGTGIYDYNPEDSFYYSGWEYEFSDISQLFVDILMLGVLLGALLLEKDRIKNDGNLYMFFMFLVVFFIISKGFIFGVIFPHFRFQVHVPIFLAVFLGYIVHWVATVPENRYIQRSLLAAFAVVFLLINLWVINGDPELNTLSYSPVSGVYQNSKGIGSYIFGPSFSTSAQMILTLTIGMTLAAVALWAAFSIQISLISGKEERVGHSNKGSLMVPALILVGAALLSAFFWSSDGKEANQWIIYLFAPVGLMYIFLLPGLGAISIFSKHICRMKSNKMRWMDLLLLDLILSVSIFLILWQLFAYLFTNLYIGIETAGFLVTVPLLLLSVLPVPLAIHLGMTDEPWKGSGEDMTISNETAQDRKGSSMTKNKSNLGKGNLQKADEIEPGITDMRKCHDSESGP